MSEITMKKTDSTEIKGVVKTYEGKCGADIREYVKSAKVLTPEQTWEIISEHILVSAFEREAEKVSKEFPDVDKDSFIMGLVAGARIESEHSLMRLFPNSPLAREIQARELKALHEDTFKGKPLSDNEIIERATAIINPNEQETPIIQLYSPGAFHDTQAIVLNKAGWRLLVKLLGEPGELIIGEAFLSDGEGGTIGIIISEDEFMKPKYRTPYTADFAQGSEEGKLDPREEIDKKVASSAE